MPQKLVLWTSPDADALPASTAGLQVVRDVGADGRPFGRRHLEIYEGGGQWYREPKNSPAVARAVNLLVSTGRTIERLQDEVAVERQRADDLEKRVEELNRALALHEGLEAVLPSVGGGV